MPRPSAHGSGPLPVLVTSVGSPRAPSSVASTASTLGPAPRGESRASLRATTTGRGAAKGVTAARLEPGMMASVARLSTPRASARGSGASTPRRREAEYAISSRESALTPRGFFAANRAWAHPGPPHTPTSSARRRAGGYGVPAPPPPPDAGGSPSQAEPSTARARYEARTRASHKQDWAGKRGHCASLLEALPQMQQRQTKSDLHRFDARLLRFNGNGNGNGGGGGEDRTNSARRQQALLQRLFNLRLSSNCFVKRRLEVLGLDAVVASLSQVCTRYGMRLLTQDDFHLALSEALPAHDGELVTHAETRLLFGLFDDDRSGIVDLEEFAEGLQLLLLNESVVLLAHCRSVVCDTHPPVDAMVSALEIDLMLSAIDKHYTECVAKSARERRHRTAAWFVALRRESTRVKTLLWKEAHKGQIHVGALQSAVRQAPTLAAAIEDLPENGIRDETFDGDDARSGPATPEPEMVFAELNRMARRRWDDSGEGGAGGDGDGDDDDTAGRRGINYETINVRNTRFRADEWKAPDEARQLAAEEHGQPLWYCRGGQVWRVRDGEVPEPVLDL